jgi:hypothetical protein
MYEHDLFIHFYTEITLAYEISIMELAQTINIVRLLIFLLRCI